MDLRSTHGLITALRSKQWQQEIEITWGVLGNGAGTVQATRTNYYYVLPQGLQRVAQAINLGRVPPIPELMVELAEKDGAYAILGPAMQLPYWGDADPYLPLHGPTHEAGEGRGRDPVNVYLRAITPLRADVHSPTDDSLVVAPGTYYNAATLDRAYFVGGNSPAFNLANSGSISGSGACRWDLLYLDTLTNSLQILQGTEGPPGFYAYPNPPWSDSTASIPIVYVRTCYGETTIEETDLEDARQIVTGVGIPQNAGWLRGYEICSGSPPANGYFLRYDNPPGCWQPAPPGATGAHNLLNGVVHPDTVAQGATRGSLIYGDATPSWNEMILGAAHRLFKVNAAGTDPAWAAFDWDDIAAAVGADMVHDHSVAGEGGQVDVTDLTDSLNQLLTGVQKTDLTDGGQTILHSHAGITTSNVQVTLLNNSGFGLTSGDVVVTGSAINESVVGTTQVGYCGKVLVAAEPITSGSFGLFWERGGPFDIRTIGAIARNDGLRTSNTIFRAESAGDPCSGSVFAVALSPAAGPASGSVSGLFLDAFATSGAVAPTVFGIQWHVDGPLATSIEVGEARIVPAILTSIRAYIYCKATGTAGNTIVDINRNGVSIFTAQANRPTLPFNDPDKLAVSGTPDITALAEGDILTIDIDGVATGAIDLTVTLVVDGAGGGGDGGNGDGAPIDAKYVVTEANPTLTAEVVRPQFGYAHPDTPPLSPNAKDDEFTAAALDPKWSWINQEAATVDLTTWPGTLLMTAPAGAGDDLRIIEQTKPAGNFTMKAKVAIARRSLNFSAVGMCMRDSATGRIITLYFDFNNSVFPICGTGIFVERFTNFNTYNAASFSTESAGNYVYLKWQDDGTNFTWSFSPNGKCWQTIGSESRTAFLASPDRVGISWAVNNATFSIEATCEWFRVTEP